MTSSSISNFKKLLLKKCVSILSKRKEESISNDALLDDAFAAALADFERTPAPQPLRVDIGEVFEESNLSFEDFMATLAATPPPQTVGSSTIVTHDVHPQGTKMPALKQITSLTHAAAVLDEIDDHLTVDKKYIGKPSKRGSTAVPASGVHDYEIVPLSPTPKLSKEQMNKQFRPKGVVASDNDQVNASEVVATAPNGSNLDGAAILPNNNMALAEEPKAMHANSSKNSSAGPLFAGNRVETTKTRVALGVRNAHEVSNIMAGRIDHANANEAAQANDPLGAHKKDSYSFFPPPSKQSELHRSPTAFPIRTSSSIATAGFKGIHRPPPADAPPSAAMLGRTGTWTNDHQARMEGGIARRAAAERHGYQKLMRKMTAEYEKSLEEPKRSLNPFRRLRPHQDE
ncbi:hypothetical protein BZA05DRAFT_419309 [Tricharina praecox]|uniref:uncharacterized protein n=1 Tax=Tricharina praecox TaxID=43433 RepID=UPI0022207844|nr:uncharacterized protein BZA05DRAFT_419309 [Tricharina praecox]KAI5850796.1 hypothetical protein BZA05DRAFT_419309 [Tricharina praecox]